MQNIKSILFSNSKYPRWLEYQEAVSLKQLGMKSNAIKKFKDLVSQNIFDKIVKNLLPTECQKYKTLFSFDPMNLEP